MKMKRFIGAAAAMAVAGTLTVGAAAETYNAYIGFQTAPYSFRNSFDDATYGKDVADGKYFNSVIVWGGNDPETFPQYEDKFDDDMPGGQAGYVLPATYTDVKIDKDGTYKVGVTDFDWALDGSSAFNLLFVSTDIPFDKDAGEDGESIAKFSDCKVIVDGTVTSEVADPVVDTEDGKKSGYTKVLFANIWNKDLESYAGAYPTKSLEIEFTVSGLGSGDADTDAPATDAPATEAPATDAPATEAPTTTGDSSKPSTNTGVEGIAVVAGVAVLAAGAVVVAKKRK